MEGDRKSCEQRWRVKPYKDGYLNFNRTCLQSPLTTPIAILLPCFPLPPYIHHFSPSSHSLPIPLFIQPLTTLRPLHPYSLVITLLDTHSTLSNHPSKLALRNGLTALQPWPISLFGLLCFHKETEIRRAGPVSTFNPLSMATSPAGTQHLALKALESAYIRQTEIDGQSRRRQVERRL